MTGDALRVRRATTDDVAALNALWEANGIDVDALEGRFTEFQLVEEEVGGVVAAIGLRIAGAEGHLHSEGLNDFALADTVRPILWERVQSVAKNHGLFRLWTHETAPFWKQAGFQEAPAGKLPMLPASFPTGKTAWLMVTLRDEAASPVSIERELAMFREREAARTEQLMRRAAVIKWVATAIAALVFLIVLIGGIRMLRH